jgi:small subunit ribosomal protein S17
MSETIEKRKLRKTRTGRVVSAKMDKTIVVEIERKFRHPTFKKVVVRTKKLYVHDEARSAKVGDEVEIVETRPLSKLKKWRLVHVLKAGAFNQGVKNVEEGS